MYNTQKYIDIVKSRLSDYRFHHSMCVAEKARELAVKYNLDGEKAYLAGVLHDITREDTAEKQVEFMLDNGFSPTSIERSNKNLHHQITGAIYVKNELKINDDEIINAVRYHTTGKADMSVFEMVIYIADAISDDRNYPNVQQMRQEADKGLLYAMLFSLSHVIEKCVVTKTALHPDTLFCYNWVVENLEKELNK